MSVNGSNTDMLNKFKSAIKDKIYENGEKSGAPPPPKPEKFEYCRPFFMGMTKEEVQATRDFAMRPIFIPRDVSLLPWSSGYAEGINGGKSDYNEDQAMACNIRLKPWRNIDDQGKQKSPSSPSSSPDVPTQMEDIASGSMIDPIFMSYFSVLDGHAGYGAAVMASKLLHKHIQDKMESCLHIILEKHNAPKNSGIFDQFEKISIDQLVRGALEAAFMEMDNQIQRERSTYLIKGGSTALVAIFFQGRLYVANAGDCRAVLCKGDTVIPMSREFTPETEKQRLHYLAYLNPELVQNEFSCIEFAHRISKKDIGKPVLCRRPTMAGWSYKTVVEEDLTFPLVAGEGKKSRLLGTIGVTRGFGDFDLYVYESSIGIKPFLSHIPEVKIQDLTDGEWTEDDVLIMGSDGLWDTISDDVAVAKVRESMAHTNKMDAKRYTTAAHDLVHEARGVFTGRGWKKLNNTDESASFDDITAFVIPIKPYVDTFNKGFLPDNITTCNS